VYIQPAANSGSLLLLQTQDQGLKTTEKKKSSSTIIF